jgi:hypothetical protein
LYGRTEAVLKGRRLTDNFFLTYDGEEISTIGNYLPDAVDATVVATTTTTTLLLLVVM